MESPWASCFTPCGVDWSEFSYLDNSTCAAGADRADAIGVRGADVFIMLVAVKKENWSFGNGVAQYLS